MVMPLWDHSPFKWPKPPYVMWALIIINFAVFFVEAGFWPDQMDAARSAAPGWFPRP